MGDPLSRRQVIAGLGMLVASVVLPTTPEAAAATRQKKPPKNRVGFGSTLFGSNPFGA